MTDHAVALALKYRAALGEHWPKIGGGLVVGLTLALVTLPQAVAFSVTLAGVPPHFGIYAAIWGVLFCALLNPSPVFHGGPKTPLPAGGGGGPSPVPPPLCPRYMGFVLAPRPLAG